MFGADPPSSAESSANPSNSATPKSTSVWGSMFKNAISQVETHLDKYLELPNDARPPHRAKPIPRQHQLQQTRKTNGSSTSLKSMTTPSRSHTPVHANTHTKDADFDSDLFDAFGLDQATPANEVEQTSKSPQNTALVSQGTDRIDPPQNNYGPVLQAELKKLRSVEVPSSPEEIASLIKSQSQRLEQLLIEGHQMASKELRLSNTIKKLQADAKIQDKAVIALQKKLNKVTVKYDELAAKFKNADQSTANIKNLNAKIYEISAQKQSLAAELKSAVEDKMALRASIEKANAKIITLQKTLDEKAAAESTRRESKLAAIQSSLDSERKRVAELQQKLLVVEEESRERELSLLSHNNALKARLEAADSHNGDLELGIREHTLPLLRQIEDMRLRYANHRKAYADKEKDMDARLRAASRDAETIKRDLDAQIRKARESAESADRERCEHTAEIAELNRRIDAEAKIKRELKAQLDEARRSASEANEKLENLKDSEPTTGTLQTSPVISHDESPSVRSLSVGGNSRPHSASSPDTPVSEDSHPAMLPPNTRKLAAQITSLKAQLQTALRQKHEFERGLIDATARIEQANAESERRECVEKELSDLKRRHGTALEMLGEKTEEVMELQADIKELKESYKRQIQDLAH